jgi:hypothetical protein
MPVTAVRSFFLANAHGSITFGRRRLNIETSENQKQGRRADCLRSHFCLADLSISDPAVRRHGEGRAYWPA